MYDALTQNPVLKNLHAGFVQGSLTLASAESCTGGLLARLFTEFPGSSAYYMGGISSYSNAAKENLLGVSAAQLNEYGAVSSQVAKQMAIGASKALQADFGVALTGVAGPGGGSETKPVGTVWCGLSYHGESQAVLLECQGDRAQIRAQAALAAMQHLESWVQKHTAQ